MLAAARKSGAVMAKDIVPKVVGKLRYQLYLLSGTATQIADELGEESEQVSSLPSGLEK
jgi:hypothetical protein